MTWVLGGVDLGFVTKEHVTKDSGLMQLPIPKTDADGMMAFDFTGVTGTIAITGTKTVESVLDLQKFVYKGNDGNGTAMFIKADSVNYPGPHDGSLMKIVNGQQDAPIDYVSDFYGTLKVKVMTLDIELVEGNPYSFVKYDMTLIVCSV